LRCLRARTLSDSGNWLAVFLHAIRKSWYASPSYKKARQICPYFSERQATVPKKIYTKPLINSLALSCLGPNRKLLLSTIFLFGTHFKVSEIIPLLLVSGSTREQETFPKLPDSSGNPASVNTYSEFSKFSTQRMVAMRAFWRDGSSGSWMALIPEAKAGEKENVPDESTG
jgi:hypothetical protein